VRRALLAGALALVLLASWATAADALLPIKGLSYGSAPSETVTVYEPLGTVAASGSSGSTSSAAAGDAPSVILVHGGGWRQQPNTTEQPTVAQNLRGHGFAVFDIDYPQASASQVAFPKEPEAIESAIAWVRQNAAKYGGDPENIELLGGSAGGNLVDLAAERTPGIRSVVELSGPTNLVSMVEMGKREELKSSLTISLAIALGCGREVYGWTKISNCDNFAFQEEWSPVDKVPASGCPHWLLLGAEEDLVPVSQQEEFLPKLQAAGCSATLHVLPGKGHGFGYWPRVNEAYVYSFLAAN
jgi:acetyl esterase/lipase